MHCPGATAIASGDPMPSLFSAAASRNVRAHWCERYDEYARAIRVGPYRELYPSGALRTEASFQEGRLHGALVIRHENGQPWLRSAYAQGIEVGPLEIFHPSGALWLEGEFEGGALHGPLRSYFPDGSLESETRFVHGREQGIARSFYPALAGGGLHSEVRVDADRMVGEPRVLDVAGRASRSTDGEAIPAAPAAATSAPRARPAPQAGVVPPVRSAGAQEERLAGD